MTAAALDSAAGTSASVRTRPSAGNQDKLKGARAAAASETGHPAHGRSAAHNGKAHKHSKHSKHRKHRKPRPRRRALIELYGLPGAPAPLAIPVGAPQPSSTPPPFQSGPITLAAARRLLWRAGFGPKPGEAEALVGKPIEEAVQALTRPSGPAVLEGPEPTDDEGNALAPADEWGEDHCWWLDRMVRSDQQLVERMTFIWHDWFANSNEKVNDQQRMLDQNNLFRENALGSFQDLFQAVTVNPAMLVFLDGIYNDKNEPNENYAREMMELFSLGADRGAYTETDVREMARALTGWRAEWTESSGLQNFRFDPSLHDKGVKTIFGQTGAWNYEDAVRLCITNPLHASYFVSRLWSYFVPEPPSEATLASLEGLYLSSNYSIRAVVEAILQHPDFITGPEMVTPPVVYNAGLLRAIGRPIDTTAWAWLSASAGQQLFYPPNVSGWDFTRWLDTSTAKARWEIASYVTSKTYCNPWPEEGEAKYSETEEAPAALASAIAYWGTPQLSGESEQCLAAFAQSSLAGRITAKWQRSAYRALRQNALRMLIATSPDMQVS